MKKIKIIITVLALSMIYQLTYAQNCSGDKVRVFKGGVGCGCHCKKKCVSPEELPIYLANGWNTWGCFTCCWVTNEEEKSKNETSVTEVYPNQVPGSVTIAFNLPQESEVTIKISDSTGRSVATVANEFFEDGSNELIWDQSGLEPGIYLLHLQSAGYSETKKISVM